MYSRALALIFALSLVIGISGCNGESASVHGVVEGLVTDQVSGRPVRDVWVTTGSIVAWTDALGAYWLSLPQGTQSICFQRAGYARKTLPVTVVGRSTVQTNLEMNPILPAGPVEISLTWGASPVDLDAHLWTSGGYRINHSCGGSLTSPPWAKLDYDYFAGHGRETITIADFAPDTYHYSIHNCSRTPAIAGSGAQVDVYSQSQLLYTFIVPHTGPADYLVWDVFEIDGATREMARLDTLRECPNWTLEQIGPVDKPEALNSAGFRPVDESPTEQ
ncbi:MAG TPA: carboxypeptidase-like regulatory domain-containing protein [Bacillota bacterium]|nr:carboxypeptidase-like regulatory domain-containing protein [Bacillota bacterium]